MRAPKRYFSFKIATHQIATWQTKSNKVPSDKSQFGNLQAEIRLQIGRYQPGFELRTLASIHWFGNQKMKVDAVPKKREMKDGFIFLSYYE